MNTASNITSLDKILHCDRLKLTGLISLCFYFIHASVHLIDGRYEDLLWSCHAGAICVSLGLFFHHARMNTVGVLLLAVGFPLWLIAVLTGGVFYPTTLLIHVGVLYFGFRGTKVLGMAKASWLFATGIIAGLLILCRCFTSAEVNVNMAYYLTPSIGPVGSPAIHLLVMISVASLLFWALETLLQGRNSCDKLDRYESR